MSRFSFVSAICWARLAMSLASCTSRIAASAWSIAVGGVRGGGAMVPGKIAEDWVDAVELSGVALEGPAIGWEKRCVPGMQSLPNGFGRFIL